MAASSPQPSKGEGGGGDSNNSTQTSPPPPSTDASDDVVSPSTTPNHSPPPPSSPPPPAAPPSSPPPPPKSTPSPPPPPSTASPPPPASSPPPPPEKSTSTPPPPDSSSPPPPPPADASPPPPSTTPPPPTSTTPPPPPATDSPPPPPPDASYPPPPPGGARPPPPPSNPIHPPASSDHKPAAGGPPPANRSAPPTSNTDVAIIAGILVGGIALLALIIICLAYSRKKKKKPQYFIDPARTPPNVGDPSQWQSPHVAAGPHQIINIPPPPAAWGPSPPQQGGTNMSSEYSSGYSGQQQGTPNKTPMTPSIGTNMMQFGYEDLALATGGFSQANLLGQGGFGYVHKGLLPNKGEVAVKSLKTGSGQGEREFQAEVEIISRVHHRHLVSLVGYCIANEQRLLVYEFVPNNTLEFHLHRKGQPVMDWSTRLKIAVGSAKGLAYLHEDCHPRIIHRDIKSANILLDNNFEAMVADFGLAKLTSDNFTHVSTRVMGTFGYLAPEYASSGKLTEKSDVYSFGVMLLELITGRRPVDPTNKTMEDSLVDWARPLLSKAIEDGNCNELVDPRLEGNYETHEMSRMVTCAAASIRHSARRRPKMSQVAHALEGDSSMDDLNEGVKPGQSKAYNPVRGGYTGGGEAYDTMAYNADMMKFRKMVMSTQDFNSSDYGTTSDEPSSSSGDNSREMPKPSVGSKRTYT